MIGWTISKILGQVFGVLYPAYCSYHAIKTPTKDDDTQWLTYWTVFSIFSMIEILLDLVIQWIPLYFEMKLVFIIWMALPYTNGALYIWRKAEPFLDDNVKKIEAKFEKLKAVKDVAAKTAEAAKDE